MHENNRWRRGNVQQGFTLLELIIVMTVIGILATIAQAMLRQTPIRANEVVLKTNLWTLRQVIDMYNGDKGYYPPSLEDLVEEGYLRAVPLDPIYREAAWGVEYDDPGVDDFVDTDLEGDQQPGIIDVYSLSEAVSTKGTPYAEW